MKTFATICIVGAVLLSLGILYVAEKAQDFPSTDAVGGCSEYVCNVTNETGTYCRISTTGYRAYPSTNSTAGYRDCLNRSTLARGIWSPEPTQSVTFDVESCMFLDDVTMCFSSTNATEHAQIISAISSPS